MYNIKIYDVKGKHKDTGLFNVKELETIRGLTEAQKTAIVSILERHGIKHMVEEVKE